MRNKRGQMLMSEKVVNIAEGILATIVIGLFIYIFFFRPFLENSELKQAEAALKQIKAEIEKMQAEKYPSEGAYTLVENNQIIYYDVRQNFVKWSIDQKKWYDSRLIPNEKGGLVDVIDKKIISKKAFDIFITLQRTINNPNRLEIIKKVSTDENLRYVKLGFFVQGPNGWFITAWPHQDKDSKWNDDSIKPAVCKSNYCLCMCKANSNKDIFRDSWRVIKEAQKKLAETCKVCIEASSKIKVSKFAEFLVEKDMDDAILVNGVTSFDIVKHQDNQGYPISLIQRAFQ